MTLGSGNMSGIARMKPDPPTRFSAGPRPSRGSHSGEKSIWLHNWPSSASEKICSNAVLKGPSLTGKDLYRLMACPHMGGGGDDVRVRNSDHHPDLMPDSHGGQRALHQCTSCTCSTHALTSGGRGSILKDPPTHSEPHPHAPYTHGSNFALCGHCMGTVCAVEAYLLP